MALSSQGLIRALVAKGLPPPNFDGFNNDVALRLWTYGELVTMPLVRKAHSLAVEGTYYVVNNAQTGIVPTYGTGLVATSPFIVIQNQTLPALNQNLYLDYIALTSIAAGACTTAVGYTAASVVIDNILRYTSGGTNLTGSIVSPNMGAGVNNSSATVYCGAIVAPAASGAARTVVGIRNVRPGVSTTVINVVGDNIVFNFGGVEAANAGSVTVANASLIPVPMPPVVIGPGQAALLYLWYPVLTAPSAATYAPEIGFWVR
jgi:hypothetical protein